MLPKSNILGSIRCDLGCGEVGLADTEEGTLGKRSLAVGKGIGGGKGEGGQKEARNGLGSFHTGCNLKIKQQHRNY